MSPEANGFLLELHEWLSMNYRNLKTQEVEGIIWGLIVAIMLTGLWLPRAFAVIVGIIFGIVAVFVLDDKRV